MRALISVAAFAFLPGACGAPFDTTRPDQPTVAALDCPRYDGVEAVATLAADHVIIFGEEIHGKNESPDAFYALACHLAARGQAIRLGLEATHTQSAGLQTFLSHPDDTGALLNGGDNAWFSHDGRSSEAMLLLLQKLAALRAKGVDVSVFAFDSDQQETMSAANVNIARDAAMARHVNGAVEGFEGAVLLLTGGFHARKEAFSIEGTDFVPMATGITTRPVLSLEMLHAGGSAWMIGEVDGEPFRGTLELRNRLPPDAPEKAFRLEPERPSFDGVYYTGPITVSLPAFPEASDP